MKRISTILNQVTSKSLVILDEIGSGTDPDEGESLAQAILEQLLVKDCYTLASTHYGHLKTFGKMNEKILVGSVSFDIETLTPTYHLQLDRIGQSYALEIALKLGFEEQLVHRAKVIKEEKMNEAEILMEQLEKEKEALLQKEIKLNQLLSDNEKMKKKYDRKIEVLENSKERIVEEARNTANELLNETKQRIDEIVKEVRNPQIKDHQVINAKHLVDDMMYKKEEKVVKQDHLLKVGDHVKVTKMNREGDIIEILKKNMIKVDLSGITVQLHEDDVIYMHPKTKAKPVKAAKRSVKMTKNASYEINVIGKRYEEAMAIVDKFLDDAIVAGYPHVRIVHGMGTGVLRKGIRKMLDKNKNVVSYRDGGPNEGGLGATLVYFEE
jgi:DNA mismatch repair protein MutS2